jgi:predicted ATPase/class 3 adenylate cyclase
MASPVEKLQELARGIDPDVLQAVMPLTGGVVTMMFTDIVGSTAAKAAVGDDVYFQQVLSKHNEIVRACVNAHKGREIKPIGDAFLIAFAVPADAVACAAQIQQQLSSTLIAVGDGVLQIRIGIHTGTPIVYRDPASQLIDLSGNDVDKAARVEALASGGQVLVSEETRTLAKPAHCHDWGLWELKGLGAHRVFEVLWPGREPVRPSGRARLHAVRFLTRFVGRESELRQIMETVKRERLVTLRGIGGVGKTRLADEAEARLGQAFEDGVLWIELADAARSESALISELVASLKVDAAGQPDEVSAVQAALQSRNVLLILNNFETVIRAAPVVARILLRCPAVHFLVTSQQLLEIDGEQQIEVHPMLVPAATENLSAAVLEPLDSYRLFAARARLRQPDWAVADGEVDLLAGILQLTDGIPLCVELAAGWVGKISLQELRDGLATRRTEMLRRAGNTALEQRHASIQACLEWSFNLLNPAERELLAKLGVFTGGFHAQHVSEVCQTEGASAMLESLRGHSLLRREESGGTTQYSLLGAVRDFALEKLAGGTQAVRLRHARYFTELADRADDEICAGAQLEGIARMSTHVGNIRAALDTARKAGDNRLEVRCADAILTYLKTKGQFRECLQVAESARAAAERLGDKTALASSQNNLGIAYSDLPVGDRADNLRKAIACYKAALRVRTQRDFPMQWAMTQNNLGNAYAHLSAGERADNLRKAIACYKAALRVRTERAFPVQWAMTQNNLGAAYGELPKRDGADNLQKAINCFEAALRVRTERDFPLDWAITQINLGVAYANLQTGDRADNLQKAITCYQAALRVYTERDFPLQWAGPQNNLGIAYRNLPAGDRAENLQKAIACYEAALRVYTEHDFPQDWAITQNNLGIAHADLPTGDRAENLRNAIACYEASARGYSAVGMENQAQQAREQITRLREK